MNNNLQELMENEELMIGFVECQSPAELDKLLKAHSIILEDGLTVEKAFELIKARESGEISAEELDNVSGGIGFVAAAMAVGAFTLAGAAISFLGGYAYQQYKNYKKSKSRR